MMQRLYRERPPDPPGLLDRLLGRNPPRNLVIEIENRLARLSKVSELTLEDVVSLAEAYGADLHRHQDGLAALYRQFLEHCVRDRRLSDAELADLAHLKAVLQLTDGVIERLHDDVAGRVYGEAVAAAIADRRLDPEERQFLARLRAQLHLDESIARRIHAQKARGLVEQLVRAAEEDERLSPDEEAELEALARNLRVEIRLGPRTRRRLDKFRLYWLIENGELPEIAVSLPLLRGERCHFALDADWHEPRKRTRRVRSRGPTLRLKIARGAYWRVGDLGVKRVGEDVMTFLDSGRVVITNRRLLFRGAARDRSLRVSSISDFTAYCNGVEIERASEPSLFLRMGRDVDLFAMILGRVIRDTR